MTASVQVSASGCVSFSGSYTATDGYTEDTDACGKVTRTVNQVGNISSYYTIVGPDGKTYNSSSATATDAGTYTCTYCVYSDKGLSVTASTSYYVPPAIFEVPSYRAPNIEVLNVAKPLGKYIKCNVEFAFNPQVDPGYLVYHSRSTCPIVSDVNIPLNPEVTSTWTITGPDGQKTTGAGTVASMQAELPGAYTCTFEMEAFYLGPHLETVVYRRGVSGGSVSVEKDPEMSTLKYDLTFLNKVKDTAKVAKKYGDPTIDKGSDGLIIECGYRKKYRCCDAVETILWDWTFEPVKINICHFKLYAPVAPGIFMSFGAGIDASIGKIDYEGKCCTPGVVLSGTISGTGALGAFAGVPNVVGVAAEGEFKAEGKFSLGLSAEAGATGWQGSVTGTLAGVIKVDFRSFESEIFKIETDPIPITL